MALQSKASIERGSADGVARGWKGLSDLGCWKYRGGRRVRNGMWGEAVEMAWQGRLLERVERARRVSCLAR
jgi:hypothetical protein